MTNESKKLKPRVDTRDDEVEQPHQEQIVLQLAAFRCQPDRQRLSNRYSDIGDAVIDSGGQGQLNEQNRWEERKTNVEGRGGAI